MQAWAREYYDILARSGIKVTYKGGYVGDGRHSSTVLRRGMMFCKTEKVFKMDEEQRIKDEKLKEPSEIRMARLCNQAMNSVNPDLTFTTEVQSDFEDNWLPTLDFKLKMLVSGKIIHTYYEKPMRTPFLTMQRSAMAEQQNMAILSNELVRRLSNIHREAPQKEIVGVIEHFTQQVVTSGFKRKQAREIIVSGVLGWKRKLLRRKRAGIPFYREGKSTLSGRFKKKLTGRENWYKKRKREEEQDSKVKDGEKFPRKKPRSEIKNKEQEVERDDPTPKAVMFVPYTWNSGLAKELRAAEEELFKLTGYKIKIIERSGTTLEELLHKSDPWQGIDCERHNCLLCHTKILTGKYKNQDCH